MNRLVYQRLSREVLWLLLESRTLRPASFDRLVAYQVYYFPSTLLLELPDEDRFEPLLDPMTREEHTQALCQALLHVLMVEERDSWVLTDERIELVVKHSQSGRASVEPLEDSAIERAAKDELRYAQQLRSNKSKRPLLQVRFSGGKAEGEAAYLGQGDGLLALERGRMRPRLSLYECMASTLEIAWMIADCPVVLHSATGSRRYPSHALVGVTHDSHFSLHPPFWRFWQRGLRGELQVLGLARESRAPLSFVLSDGSSSKWERNAEPLLDIGSGRKCGLHSEDFELQLRSRAFDLVEVENRAETPVELLWHEALPLELGGHSSVPVQGSQLRGLRTGDESARMQVESTRREAPTTLDLIAVRAKTAGAAAGQALFGFEQPAVRVHQLGFVLESEQPRSRYELVVGSDVAVGPLLRLALDGCSGCKCRALSSGVVVENRALLQDRWRWLHGPCRVQVGSLEFRLEALQKLSVIFAEPQLVDELSDDPGDAWAIHGWRLRLAGGELCISGGGRSPMFVDEREAYDEMRLAAAESYRVEVGGGIYRIDVHARSERGGTA